MFHPSNTHFNIIFLVVVLMKMGFSKDGYDCIIKLGNIITDSRNKNLQNHLLKKKNAIAKKN